MDRGRTICQAQLQEQEMIIGIPKEIKEQENRIAIVPSAVADLSARGHQVVIEEGAGLGSGIADREYEKAGAKIVSGAVEIWNGSEMVLKVKEPLEAEYKYLREGLLLFTYLHLAPLRQLTDELLSSRTRALAYETVQDENGLLPILAPMSEVAGRLAVQAGAHFLEKESGGKGVLLGGATGAEPGRVVILGSGTVGRNSGEVALGMGASTVVFGRNREKLERLSLELGGNIETKVSSPENIAREIKSADLVIGAVLVPGGRAPILVSREQLKKMQPGSVIVDVAIDQGGCFETSRATTHQRPVYEVDGVLHYCVANMPGAVPRTSTRALIAATLPYVTEIAEKGVVDAIRTNSALRSGVNTWDGKLYNKAVAMAQDREWAELDKML
jgi:alanine dehydrogenase